MSAAVKNAPAPLPHDEPPFAVLMGNIAADIPVLATKEAAHAFAQRGAQETAGNVEFTILSLPLLLKRNEAYQKLVERVRAAITNCSCCRGTGTFKVRGGGVPRGGTNHECVACEPDRDILRDLGEVA